jgi:hypothetical protein
MPMAAMHWRWVAYDIQGPLVATPHLFTTCHIMPFPLISILPGKQMYNHIRISYSVL